uniref:Serine/threonine-protein phosphatase n=1 Tax=Panagrolaimus sp. PS1159 TaxID=55785 RepID=A0AC35FQS3_9BILA
MTTKDEFLFSTDKLQSITNIISHIDKSSQYCNLNLNQNQKCPILYPVQSQTKSYKNDKNCVSDKYDKNEQSEPWNKSADLLILNDKAEEKAKKKWKKDDLTDANSSTLSLHISSFKNSEEILELHILNSGNIGLKRNKINMNQQLFPRLIIQNPFDFPRQQKDDNITESEVMAFTANQRLLSSDPFTSTTDTKEENDDDNKTGTLLATIFGVFGGFLVLGLFAFGGFFLYRRYRRRRQNAADAAAAAEIEGDHEYHLAVPSSSAATINNQNNAAATKPYDNSDESPAKDPADVEKSVSIPKTFKNSKSVNVVHIDHTDVMVPAELKREETRSLLKSMKKTQKIQAIHESELPTSISKVLTYCTDDDITLNNDRPARETCEDLSGSGKPTEFEALLMRLISHGPRQYNFKFDELQKLLEAATKVFESEPSLLECPVPSTVYGDIHGQYSDLHRWFNLNGWPHQTRSVFLGDFVDRGSHGVEVVALLSCLKIVYPDKIYIVRGNHEEESLNRAYSFYEEVICRFSSDKRKDGYAMYENFKNLFMHLPLAVLIGGRVLGMHGGLSPKMETLQAIRDIKRPIDDFEVGSLECDLVWSDPDTAADTGFRPNLDREPNNGIGQLFAADTVKETCDRLNVDLIIRGHQAPLHGYALFADGRMMTLFSAPGYKGSSSADVNMGACIEFDKEMKITIKQIKVSERFRQNRVNDVEKMRVQRKEVRKRIAVSKGNEKKAPTSV